METINNKAAVSAAAASAETGEWEQVWASSHEFTSSGSFNVEALDVDRDTRITATAEFSVYIYNPDPGSEETFTDTVSANERTLPAYVNSNGGRVRFYRSGKNIGAEFLPYEEEYKGMVIISTPVKATVTKIEQFVEYVPPLEYDDRYIGFSEYGDNPKFNIQTKRMMYTLPCLGVGGGDRAVSVSLVYDSKQCSGIKALCAGMPEGWKADAHMFLVNDNGTYKYIDGAGYTHKFVPFENDSSRLYDEDGMGLILTPSTSTIEDSRGNTLKFTGGRLTERKQGCSSKATVKYEYDSGGKLTRIYDSRNTGATAPTHYIEFEYTGGMLSGVKAVHNGVAVKRINVTYPNGKMRIAKSTAGNKFTEISYGTHGKIDIIADGESGKAYKTYYSNNTVAPDLLRVSRGTVDASGAFTERETIIKWNSINFQQKDFTTVCGAVFESNTGITTAYQLDRRGRTIGAYEGNVNHSVYKTLTPEVGKRVTPTSGTAAGTSINGVASRSFTNTLTLAGIDPRQTGEDGYRYYALNFHLRHSCDAARIRVKLICTLSDRSTTERYVDVNAHAYDAWQQVSVPVDLKNDTNIISSMTLSLSVPGTSTSVSAVAGGFLIAPGSNPRTYINPMSSNMTMLPMTIDCDSMNEFGITFASESGSETTVNYSAPTFFMTSSDVCETFSRVRSHYSVGGVKCCDLVCNGGTKVLANVSAITFNGMPFFSFEWKVSDAVANGYLSTVATETTSPDDRSRTKGQMSFCSDGIHERSFITVCTEKDKTLSEADTDECNAVGELSRVTDYYGNTLKETDAYGVSKVYTYDGYGTLTGAKLVGSDGSEMTLQSNVQDGSGNITSVHMPASGADITYSEPFGLPSEIYPKSRSSSGTYSRTGAKTVFGYDTLYENLLSADDYDGTVKKKGITFTYSGNEMTASDGASKYKVVETPASGKVSCYEIDSSGTENLVSETTESDNSIQTKYYRGSATDTVTVSMSDYGNVTSISGGGNASFGYDNGSASSYAAVLSNVHDNYSGRSYFYDRDHSYNVCGWKISGKFEARQVTSGGTLYTYSGSDKIRTDVVYDQSRTIGARIEYTKNYSADNVTSDVEEDDIASWKYEYNDAFGRVTKKSNKNGEGWDGEYNYTYAQAGSRRLPMIATCNYNGSFVFNNDFMHFNTSCEYDDSGRLKKLTEVMQVKEASIESGYGKIDETKVIEYTYDAFGRIIKEKTTRDGFASTNTYQYNEDGRLSYMNMNGYPRNISYDDRGRYCISSISGGGGAQGYSFRFEHDNYGNRIKKGYSSSTLVIEEYAWTRGHLLGGITFYDGSSTSYTYGYDGIRTKKVCGGVTTEYYYDGHKLLGEDRSDGKKIRYLYDADGVCGIRYNGGSGWRIYTYVKDIFGSVVMLKDSMGAPITRYEYDSRGNVTVTAVHNESLPGGYADVGEQNPIRWRGHYYDAESGLYYAEGRYYDPWEGIYLDGMDIPTAISEMYLDRNGIMCDNILEFIACAYSIMTGMSKDPSSTEDDANEGIPWWGWLLIGIGIVVVVAAVAVSFGAGGTLLGAVAGATLKGMAFGAGIGAGSSFVTQWITKGFDNIDWGQVLIDGLSGAAIGALMASPLNAVVTGIGVGVVGFTQSVITDAYTSNWDISKVRWGNAIAIGAFTGLVSGAGKALMNTGNAMKVRYSAYMQQSFPIAAAVTAVGKAFSSRIVKYAISGINAIIKKLLD